MGDGFDYLLMPYTEVVPPHFPEKLTKRELLKIEELGFSVPGEECFLTAPLRDQPACSLFCE